MYIGIQGRIIATQPVTCIGIADFQLPVADYGLYAPDNIFTGFNHHTVHRILRNDDVDILPGDNGVEICHHPLLPDDASGIGKTIRS
jgi:hypothetical protein